MHWPKNHADERVYKARWAAPKPDWVQYPIVKVSLEEGEEWCANQLFNQSSEESEIGNRAHKMNGIGIDECIFQLIRILLSY